MTELSAFYISGNDSSRSSLEKYGGSLDRIFPTGLEVTGDCKVVKSSYKTGVHRLLKETGEENIFPVLSNYKLKPEESNCFLVNQKCWSNVYEMVINELVKYELEGLNLNLEGVNKQNKNLLIDFIAGFYSSITGAGLRFGITLPAKAERNGSDWAGAYDYYVLGDIVDFVAIMAYDYHWVNGPPGAIAPYYWVQTVIDYAIMEIPVEKLRIVLPLYGYDWPVETGEAARGLSYQQVMKLKEKQGVSLEWDQQGLCPYFRYQKDGVEHEVWFENKKSLLLKIDLIREYDLAGIAFWRLGLEDPELWNIIK